ncbi:MAG: phospholipid scramblase-related protein [Ferruginibacter sp.]|nr:scramblase [Ferruginibacter sp.]
MSMVFPDFFEKNTFFIDEKIGFFKFTNAYKVYDEYGEIGLISQRLSTWQKFLRLLINKAMMPFHLQIIDLNGDVLASINRGWTFWMSKITITDNNNDLLGSVKQKFAFLKPTFIISDEAGSEIARITGDWKGWNFTIVDTNNNLIGTISKKWNGILKEAFTTADKYIVDIVPAYAEDKKKIAIVSCAITIDMVLKESK